MGMIIFDVITLGLLGCASVIALRTFWRGGNGSGSLLLVTVLVLLSVAGLLQGVKLMASSSTAAPTPPPPVVPPLTESKTPMPLYGLPGRHPEKYDSDVDAMIEGVQFPARGVQFCSGLTQTWEFTIDDKYATFQALLNLTGDPSPGTVVRFEVVTERSTVDKTVKSGGVEQIEVPLTGVRQLKLVTTSTKNQDPCKNLTAQWVDAKVLPK